MNRKDKIKAAVDLVMSRNYGDVILHQEFAAVMHENGLTPVYRDVMQAASKKCVDSGRMIESVHKVGYRVVNPDDYTGQSIKCIASGAKKIDNGARILSHAPVCDMSLTGLEAYNKVNDRMSILRASLAGAKVEISMLGEKRRHPLAITERTSA